ncbi:phosphoenolpyruvate synthase [Gandjariella thermophila]|uniref:phosphoenolpyruvate synthase n=1 Tax=Gandjariella thermophila TaxID=1931992 RepID=UPI001CEFA230|nr:phosphoenolpyruvate synthase [Gandjariella thermophila]
MLTARSEPGPVARFAGGKGHNLYRLTRAGLAVPPWAAVGTDVFAAFRSATGLGERIARAVAELSLDTADEVAARIAESFAATELDPTSVAAIEQAHRHLGDRPLAVRSSAGDEDSAQHSFAGQHASYLNVVGLAEVLEKVKLCWTSAYSARSLTYRLMHDLPTNPVDMAVVLQAMVPAEVSGVLFTANPLTGRTDEALISSVYGLGEGLVSGAADADTVTVDRASGTVKDTVVGQKTERMDVHPAGSGCVTADVDPAQRDRLSLSAGQLDTLRGAAARIEALFGGPQDVEWAFADGRLWVLQSRPITNIAPDPDAEIRLWDNSNIVESFGAVTAPLTFSFARHSYHRVYRDYCALLGVPRAQLDRMDSWLANMLGYFDGRVYYNVLNWYKVIRLLPAYRLNARILAAATGVREPSAELAAGTHPLECRWPAQEAIVRLRVAVRFGWAALTVHRLVERFLRDFHAVYARYDAVDYTELRPEQVYRHYLEVERALLSRWGGTAVLDHVICLSYGVLHLLTNRWLPDMPEWVRWQVVKVGEDDVESTQPARRLAEIARTVHADPDLGPVVRELPAEGLQRWLTEATGEPAAWLRRELDRYLDDFGYRNANELKLEEPDLRDDPVQLFGMLKDAVNENTARPSTTDGGESYLDDHLGGWRRAVYDRVRRRVRDALRERERVRFARTRAFGIARRMFRAIGEGLHRAGALADPTDVFFLRLEELRDAFAGTIAHRELRPLAGLRRRQRDKQRMRPAPPPRFTTRGSVYWGELRPDVPADPAGDGGTRLRGTPCSPGVVTGEARVVDNPREVGSKIVVTYRTDPGWVGVLPSAAALVIERGSPLSHVAIVARELGVPTVVQIPDLTTRVRTGMTLTVDGGQGTVEITEAAPDE